MKLTAVVAAAVLSLSTGLAVADDASVAKQGKTTERAVVLDFGALDTLDALGLQASVVAVPRQGLPEYLSQFDNERYADVGGLKTPNLETIAKLSPSMVLMTGRSGEHREALEEITTVVDVSLGTDTDYMTAFDANIRKLAERFGAGEQAEKKLKELHEKVSKARTEVPKEAKVLVVTHNDGRLMLNKHPVVYQVLQLPEPVLPPNVKSEKRGERVFTPLSVEAIQEIKPAVLLVVDRSAAIGGEPLHPESLQKSLGNTKIKVLSPALWYLSGGGLQSLSLQIDEVVDAL